MQLDKKIIIPPLFLPLFLHVTRYGMDRAHVQSVSIFGNNVIELNVKNGNVSLSLKIHMGYLEVAIFGFI